MDRSDDEPTEEPTNTSAHADREGSWMVTNWIGIAVISVGFTFLLALGMLQWTGLIDVMAPVADTELGQWIAFGIVALAVVLIAAWSWSSVIRGESDDDSTSPSR